MSGGQSGCGRLLCSSFFGSSLFGHCFCRGHFSLGFDSRFYGFGFDRFDSGFSFDGCFRFDRFNSGFGFNGFGFSRRFTCESDTREKDCSGSASKQFRHERFPLFDTLPGGIFRGRPAIAH